MHRLLQDFNRIRRQPDVDLLELDSGAFLEFLEELTTLSNVGSVNEYANQIIAIQLLFLTPHSLDRLCLAGNSAESLLKLDQCFRDEIVGDRTTIIEPPRQKNLEPPK
jgi:hypothetical protein